MKIGLYTDIHASYNSSILPLFYKDNIYTTRLNMIINTFKWMYKIFDENEVDIICNCGDLFDSHTLRSEEIKAVSEAFSYSKGIREIHIPGNHEILDDNLNFYSNALLRNFNFITLVDKPSIIDGISVLPYMKSDNVTTDILKSIKGNILISHLDIEGSHLRPDYIMDSGINPELLAEYFKIVFNGHIHTPEIIKTSKNIVMNIGSTTSMSFNDSNEYIPSICIYDTSTEKLTRINNPYAILFRRLSVNSIASFIKKYESYDNKYTYSFRVTCPYNIRNNIKEIIESKPNIIASRVISSINNISIENHETIKSSLSKIDILNEFNNYIKSDNVNLKAPINNYNKIISELNIENS